MEDKENFEDLEGKTIVAIAGLNIGSYHIEFTCSDGSVYNWGHNQNCCEMVDINDIIGDIDDLIGSPILRATEDSNDNNSLPLDTKHESYTWTFYNIATAKGHVTIKWYGSSNSNYSEKADYFYKND